MAGSRSAPAARARVRRRILRRRAVAGALVLAVLVIVVAATVSGGTPRTVRSTPSAARSERARAPARRPRHAAARVRAATLPAQVAVGELVVTFVDPHRSVRYLDGSVRPRTLVTEIRYPALGPRGANDLAGARADRTAGPYPLVVFGHGFAEGPDAYSALLDAWARAGYIVAAPTFPLTGPSAPGGLSEPDLVNQPADVSLVITQMLGLSRRAGALHGLIAGGEIAVSGQSDGGDTALADAYDPALADPRVRAAVILSGAEIPYLGPFRFPRRGPPLLATQGSADTINLPSATTMFYDLAPHPRFLLTLIGAPHLPPYTTEQPYLGVVERVTIAFLDHYLEHRLAALGTMRAAGNLAGVASLSG